jgi:hypothetical protein
MGCLVNHTDRTSENKLPNQQENLTLQKLIVPEQIATDFACSSIETGGSFSEEKSKPDPVIKLYQALSCWHPE